MLCYPVGCGGILHEPLADCKSFFAFWAIFCDFFAEMHQYAGREGALPAWSVAGLGIEMPQGMIDSSGKYW